MPNINDIRSMLPKVDNGVMVIMDKQNTRDIIDAVLSTHGEHESDYDKIYRKFYTGDIETTCRDLWRFCKNNLNYIVESENYQSVKTPSAILKEGGSVDCKHYSLFIGGILDAIKANQNVTWNWCYRFASYDNNRSPGHVFVVVKDDGREYWIDPVLNYFNERLQPTYFKDKKAMSLVKISGIGAAGAGTTITVDKVQAENSFLVMVNQDLFGLKSMLKSNPSVTTGPVQQWYIDNGYDFKRLLNILKY